jgi:anti-sigma factor RsiW
MNCDQARPIIQPYADGELDAARIFELEQHLRDCPACARARQSANDLKKVLKNDALFFRAPDELRRRLKVELRSEAGGPTERTFWNWNWLTAVTSSTALACLVLLLTVTFTRPSVPQQLAQEIVSSHIRSLMADHALDVVSTDRHTVKPWFDGKLDFSPPVKDLAAQGFPLIGGRLDYLGGRAVAALVFQRHKHVINLFSWPAGGTDSEPGPLAPLQGYNLVHWSQAGMSCWAVSDVNAPELLEFAQTWVTNLPSAK